MIQIAQIVRDVDSCRVHLGCTCGDPAVALYPCGDDQLVFCTHCGEITTRERLLNESTIPQCSEPIQWVNVSDRAECPLINVALPATVRALPGWGARNPLEMPCLITKISTEKCFLRLESEKNFSLLHRQQEVDLACEHAPLAGHMPGVVEEVLWPHGSQGPAYYKIRLVPLTLEQKTALETFFQSTCGLDFESRLLLFAPQAAFRSLRSLLRACLPKAHIKVAATEADFQRLAREFNPEFCVLPMVPSLLEALGHSQGGERPRGKHLALILLLPERTQTAIREALLWGADEILYPDSGKEALSRVVQRCRQFAPDPVNSPVPDSPPEMTTPVADKPVADTPADSGSLRRLTQVRSVTTDEDMVRLLCMASETHDLHSSNHLNRIAAYTAAIARQLGLPSARVAALATASKLHDIGKLGVPDAILRKTSALTADERNNMQEHTRFGYRILQASNSELMRLSALIALRHHERADGAGYPDGLAGDKITLEPAIVTTADVFDALTTQRAYKAAWSNEKAVEYVQDQAGRMFVPEVIEAFLRVLPEIERSQLHFLDDFRDVWTERRIHPRLPAPPVPLRVEIAIPDQTFRPFTLSGLLQNISSGGLKVLLHEVSSDLFALLVSARRYAKLNCHAPEWRPLDHAFCGVTWIDYYAVPDPRQCLIGLSFQKEIPNLDELLRTLEPA